MNLTETGLELAMSQLNTTGAWGSPWTLNGSDASATYSGFSLSAGATGQVKVYVQNYAGSNPLVVAKGIVTPPSGATIIKMVEVSGIAQRSLFAKGLVGRNGLSFSGNNAGVDSWDSDPTAAAAGAYTPVGYSAAVKNANGSIAAVSVTATDAVGNANIWGTASVGGNSTSSITVGPQGSVGPFGTANGTKDPNSISANFTDNLPAVTTPTPSATNLTYYSSLPHAGDAMAADGKYYYQVASTVNSSLSITSGNVVLLFTTLSGTDSINLAGNNNISIASGASLAIYTAGNIKFAGNAAVNNNNVGNTTSLQIWSTNTNDPASNGGTVAQSITIAGNGNLSCTCYAPNASLSAKGGGNSGALYGAFVAYSVTMTGNDQFHYDENLGRMGNSGSFSPSKWRELVNSTDRATYDSHF